MKTVPKTVWLKLVMIIVAILLLSFAAYAVLHELGHLIVVYGLGGKVTNVALFEQNDRMVLGMTYDLTGLPGVIVGYAGGLFAAAVMLVLYFKLPGVFVRKSLGLTVMLGMAWFSFIGMGVAQGLSEGMSRQLYLNNALFDDVTIILSMVLGVVVYCRYVFVPPKGFKTKEPVGRLLFGR